jgi:hypothetical protein
MDQQVTTPERLPSTPDLDQARRFLAKALPWPIPGEGYVNIYWTRQGQGYDRPMWTGRAVSSVNEAANTIQFALKDGATRDVYVAMSSQRECEERTSAKGHKYRAAVRSQQNAVALKSFYIDLDAKGTDKNSYASKDEAIEALAAFLKATGLPKPSIIVDSGGGYHVHFTVSSALTPARWKELAYALAEATKQHGLRCDVQCTIDSARVLRVAGTFNRKTDPPRPVRIAGTPTDFDYNVERLEQALALYKVAVPAAQTAASFLEDPALFPPRAKVADELGAGIDTRKPVNLDDLAAECAFVREALVSGGQAYSQSMWNLTTLIATFIEGGRADAHRMGDKHPGYTKETTDELFDRKEREKEQKGLGWPSCHSISGSGSTACQACPHFAAGKSPLHLARRALPPRVTASVSSMSFQDPYAEFSGPAFPIHLLPSPLVNLVAAEHQAMGADESALALAALTAIAGAIHAESKVKMGDGWYERPIIWSALVVRPRQ